MLRERWRVRERGQANTPNGRAVLSCGWIPRKLSQLCVHGPDTQRSYRGCARSFLGGSKRGPSNFPNSTLGPHKQPINAGRQLVSRTEPESVCSAPDSGSKSVAFFMLFFARASLLSRHRLLNV